MSRKKLWPVFLSEHDACRLREIINDTAASSTVRKRCLVLLYSDESNGLIRQRKEIADIAGVSLATAKNIAKLYCQCGIPGIVNLNRNINSDIGSIKVDESMRRALVRLSEREPPNGAKRWSLRMISEEFERETGVRLGISTINRALKREGKC